MRIHRLLHTSDLAPGLSFSSSYAQIANQPRQAYRAPIHPVQPSEAEGYERANREYSVALAAHGLSEPVLNWNACGSNHFDFLWLFPIEQLNDLETSPGAESRVDERTVQGTSEILKYVTKTGAWSFRFEIEMWYPKASAHSP